MVESQLSDGRSLANYVYTRSLGEHNFVRDIFI